MALQSVAPALPQTSAMDPQTAMALHTIRGLAQMMGNREDASDELSAGIVAIATIAKVELERTGQL